MRIEAIESAYHRLPLEAMGDAGHGAIDSEEIVTVKLRAGGLEGHGYAYTIGRGGRAVQAIAALDIALWDLRGLREKKPLYALLGAAAREIPAYGSGVDLPKPLGELLAQTEGFLARGLPGVKVKVGKPEARVAAVRKLIGERIALMIDANMAWSAEQALERGRRLEPFGLYWYEEPTIPEDVAGHARLARELAVPIALGESLHSPHEFRSYIEERAVEVVQIDPVTHGGISASVRALEMANAAGLKASSHYCDELAAHLLCAAKEPVYLEKHAFALDRYLEAPQVVSNGRVRPSEVPGTGMRFAAKALAPYRL